MYVPGTAIDVCIVLTLMYYKFSIKIRKKTQTRGGFLEIMYKMCIYKKNRHLCFHFLIVLFLFSVTIPKLTMLSFSAKMCFVLFFNDLNDFLC